MFDGELLGVSVVHPAVGIHKVELLAHADDGAAGVAVQQRVVQLPVVVQIRHYMVIHIQLQPLKV